MNYFDTSARIKRFAEEAGSQRVEALLAADPQLATSKVAYAKAHAGLARKLREGVLSPAAHRRVSRQFDSDWRAYIRVDLLDHYWHSRAIWYGATRCAGSTRFTSHPRYACNSNWANPSNW